MSLRTDHHRAAAQLHTAAADVRSIAAQRAANITSASPGRIEDQRSTPQVTCGNNSQSTPDDQGELAMPSHAPEATASGDSPTLRRVRSEFPGFEIWRETAVDRIRFIARARDLGTSPHTVITGDLGELRDALAGQIGTAGLPGEGEDRRP